MYMNDILTIPVNLAGLPGMSIPAGFSEGLPVGLQIIGKHFDEHTMYKAAYAFEQATDFHTKKPVILGERLMNFETVIGLEVHVELKTNSKIFSSAPAHFGAEPNSNTNVVDWSYPGVLPVMNKGALEFGMKAALALNCEISKETHFDRKTIFTQITRKHTKFLNLINQSDMMVGLKLKSKAKRKIRIERVHLEEDAGKNIHGTDGYSYVDLNRQGTPLIEIVSEADMRSPEEAYAYLEALRSIIQFTEVSDVKMEEGSMRCDANISLRPYGQEEFGTKAELKNLNSMNFVKKV